MNYNYAFLIVNGTTRTDPSRIDMRISKGRIVNVSLYFPLASGDKVAVQIEHHASQIFPANPDGYYFSTLTRLDIPDCVNISEQPYILKARGWNSSGGDITVGVGITVIPFSAGNEICPPAG